MIHNFSDLLERINIPFEDVAMIFHSTKNCDFCKCYENITNKDILIEEYQRFQCTTDKADYFADKGYIFSFIRDGHNNAFFYGCYINHGVMTTKPNIDELIVARYEDFIHPEWYEWIGGETPKGHGIQYYYQLIHDSRFSDLKNKMIIYDISSPKTVQHTEKVLCSKKISITDHKIEAKYFG